MMTVLVLLLIVLLIAYEARRWPERKRDIAKAAELEADANDALKSINKLARDRARSMSIPIPIAPEDTTGVIALHPHHRVGEKSDHQHQREPRPPSQYRIVTARSHK